MKTFRQLLFLSTLTLLIIGQVTWAQEKEDRSEGPPVPVAVHPAPIDDTVDVEAAQPDSAEEDAWLSLMRKRRGSIRQISKRDTPEEDEMRPSLLSGPATLNRPGSGLHPPRGPSTYNYNYRRHECFLNGRWVPHGTEGPYSSANPCWTKLCWGGRLVNRDDGCHYQGRCYPINRHFTYQCNTMSCTKSSNGLGRHRYMVRMVRPGCQDIAHRCRRTHESGFSASIQGTVYRNCMCRPDGYTVCFNDRT